MKYFNVDFPTLPLRAFQPVAGRMRVYGGGPDMPDPDPQIGAAQQKLADLAERQQNFYETNFAPKLLSQLDQTIEISRNQATKQAELQDYQLGLSKKYDERYWSTQVPLENELIAKARKYNEAGEQERMAGEAGADVEQATALGKQSLQRGLAMRGINAGSAAGISAMADMQTSSALAKAGAMNKTREAARQMGWTRMGEAAALGRGLPGFGASSSALAMGAGQAAMGAGQAGLQGVSSAVNTSNSASHQTQSAYGQIGQLGLGNYNAQLSGYNTAAQAHSAQQAGIGSLVGTAAMAAMFMSDRRLKTDIVPVGQLDNGLTAYSFRYKAGGPTVIGVMADEVEMVKPEAVVKGAFGGYDAVRYDLL